MKRIAISALTISLLAGPMAEALATPMQQPSGSVVVAQHHGSRHYKPEAKRYPRWHKGSRYSEWKRHKPVRDWKRYGLRRPAPGHQWIRVGNDYLLVGVVSGVVAGIIAAR